MECNKDEANRAKELAQKKFLAKDLDGARKFANKATQLFPGLEGMQQMMAVLDVHMAAEKKFNGEMDWYGVLNVNPGSDDSTVRKQYRKLALLLHPDKNKSVGADAAFKILSEAWSILSDRDKRSTYDMKRQPKGRTASQRKQSSGSDGNNGFYNFAAYSGASQKVASRPPHPSQHYSTASMKQQYPVPPPAKPRKTFWTSCPSCKMQYEYDRMYVNHNLLCQNCGTAFSAVETPVPVNGVSGSYQWSFSGNTDYQGHHHQQYPNQGQQFVSQEGQKFPNQHYPNAPQQHYATSQQQQYANVQQHLSPQQFQNNYPYCKNATTASRKGRASYATGATNVEQQPTNANYAWGPFTRSGSSSVAGASPAKVAAAANLVQQAYEKAKRDREEAQHSAKLKEEMQRNNSQNRGSNQGPGCFVPSGASEQIAVSKPYEQDNGRKRRRKMDVDYGDDFRDEEDDERLFSKTENTYPGMTCGNVPKYCRPKKKVDGRVERNGDMNNSAPPLFQEQKHIHMESYLGKNFDTNRSKPLGRPPLNRDLPAFELKNSLMELGRKLIRKGLETKRVYADASTVKASERVTVSGSEEETKLPAEEVQGVQRTFTKQYSAHEKKQAKIQIGIDSACEAEAEITDPVVDTTGDSIAVIDPDFHDFDQERTEAFFKENQVWAAYDNDDGMPRFYAKIHKVISLDPFEVKMSWLDTKSNDELAVGWIDAGFTMTFGDFKPGKTIIYHNIPVFSHVIRWDKGQRGAIRILPKQGDVWAIYREWCPDWFKSKNSDVGHQYDMVEVLSDFSEEKGVSVVPLVKLPGFKTIFQKKLVDAKDIYWIHPKELFRFSHQVPSYTFTGEESEKIPKGCRELDPAATPTELLQVADEGDKEDR